jgi:hypothetical protein
MRWVEGFFLLWIVLGITWAGLAVYIVASKF